MGNTWQWSDNTYGILLANASSSTDSLSVTTVQGTFPDISSGDGQQFGIVLNPNLTGLADNSNTERCTVIANDSGTFTLATGLAYDHTEDENVVLVATSASLDYLYDFPYVTTDGTFSSSPELAADLSGGVTSFALTGVNSQAAGTPAGSVSQPPMKFAAEAQVVNFLSGTLFFGNIPTVAEDSALDIYGACIVSDLVGTNGLMISTSNEVYSGDTLGTLDIGGGTAYTTGSDLSFSDGVVTTTAGGFYSVTVMAWSAWA